MLEDLWDESIKVKTANNRKSVPNIITKQPSTNAPKQQQAAANPYQKPDNDQSLKLKKSKAGPREPQKSS